MKNKLIFTGIALAVIAVIVLTTKNNNYSAEQKKYIASVQSERAEKDDYMKNDPSSPFNQDSNAHFSPLKYFDVNPDFAFKSKLYEYKVKDTVRIFGTKGEERKAVKYGYVIIKHNGKNYKVKVYKGTSRSGEEYYSIWYTDKTTGNVTYGVGRYLDFELNPDKDYVYTIDFNKSYNPYCAYSARFSCAVPTKEDHIDMAVEAGEKKFH